MSRKLSNPLPKGPYGTVISNPPYGERLDSEPALIALHSLLGRTMKNQFGGWNLSLFSASPDLLSSLQLRADKQFKAKNGPLDCVQKNYHVAETTADSKPATVAEDYANRLRKNIKKLEKWARQEGIECYRLYDADLPEYNVAVDRYGEWVGGAGVRAAEDGRCAQSASTSVRYYRRNACRYWGLRQINWC